MKLIILIIFFSSFLHTDSEHKPIEFTYGSHEKQKIDLLALDLLNAWENKKSIFLCGNGGSGANAIHIANDLLYGSGACGGGTKLPGLRVEALTANQGIITCLSNDVGYENVSINQTNYLDTARLVSSKVNADTNLTNLPGNKSFNLRLRLSILSIIGFDSLGSTTIADLVTSSINKYEKLSSKHFIISIFILLF